MPLHDPEDAPLRDKLGTIGTGNGGSLLRRQLVGALGRYWAARAEGTDDMGHPPDAVLIGNQQTVVLPCQSVGPVQILDMPTDPLGAPRAIVAQQREVTSALLGDQDVTVRQDKKPSWIDQTGRKRRRRKPRRHLQCLLAVGDDERPIGDDGSGLRWRQIGGIEVKATANLVFGGKILGERIIGCRLL